MAIACADTLVAGQCVKTADSISHWTEYFASNKENDIDLRINERGQKKCRFHNFKYRTNFLIVETEK